jgi:phosphoserine phosphatase
MRWPAFEHVFFDCDSTLTTVEGIDVLAATMGKGWRVEVLTRAAMNGDVALEEVYAKRLAALKPTRSQIRMLRQVYKEHAVPDAAATIGALHLLGHQVYIISGGLAEPVAEFGVYLGVPRDHIRAVEVQYDELSGTWWRSGPLAQNNERLRDFEHGGLTISDGKGRVIRDLLAGKNGRSLLVGDGMSDLQAAAEVDLFVGFGGAVQRENVLAAAPVFLHSLSLAPILLLASGPNAVRRLADSNFSALAKKGQELIAARAVTFQDERLGAKFWEAFQVVQSRS